MEDNSYGFGHFREPEYTTSYSPWSCDTFGSYIGSKDMKSKDGMSSVEVSSCSAGLYEYGVCIQARKLMNLSCKILKAH